MKTLDEDDELMYGKDAQEWLQRWDEGKTVWSIEMGGLGPGYEQCIQITCAEILRFILSKQYDYAKWKDHKAWEHDQREIREMGFQNPEIKKLGLSGAQWGAAMSIATYLYQRGPIAMMNDNEVKDRHIQVSKVFP